MRVLMTADTVGGVWTYALMLVRALGAFGVDVHLAVLGPPPSRGQLADLLALPNVEWSHRPGPLEWMPGGPEAVDGASEWLLSIAARIQPDIVHLNGFGHAAWPFTCPVVVVAHSCVCSWWRAVKRAPAPPRLNAYRWIVSRGLNAADLVVAPTRSMLNALCAEYDAQMAIEVIPNGTDVRVPVTWGKEALVFSAARFDDEAKNVKLLERAAPAFGWPVVVAGDGDDGGNGNLTRLGRVDHTTVQSWLARASIYALPARYEPFGLSILEAAQLRCALVLGDIPTLREIWGAAALYVDPDDADALEAQVNALVRHDRLRQRMASAARHRAARYTARACASAYYRTYRSLVEGVHPGQRPQPLGAA